MKKKILLIQSAETHGNGAKEQLEDRGYKIIWAGSGLSGLMLARNMSIDIILLDVALPDIEGMDLCRLFRRRQETHDLPILLLTPRGYRPERVTGGSEGPDGYLEKPYGDIDLDKKIGQVLHAKGNAGIPGEQAPLPAVPVPNAVPALITLQQALSAPESRPIAEHAPHELPKPVAIQEHAPPQQRHNEPAPVLPPAGSAAPAAEAATDQSRKNRPETPILPFHLAGDTVTDPDTGLFGRAQFEAMLDKEFKRAVRFKQHMSVMLIDLDGRTRGQTADEALVKDMISLVQKTIREVDTAAWWSGESFIVLLPNTSATDALQAAARTLESVAVHPFSWPDATRITMNVGVAGLPNPALTSPAQLIESANAAVKRARDLMTPPPFDVRSKRR